MNSDNVRGHDASAVVKRALLEDDISEIHLNSYESIFFKKKGKVLSVGVSFSDSKSYCQFLNEILENSNTDYRIDEQGYVSGRNTAKIDASWVDSRTRTRARVNIIAKPSVDTGPATTICKLTTLDYTYDHLIENGTMTVDISTLLQGSMAARLNILIAGNTGAGKSTLLEVMCKSGISNKDRVILIEDTPELDFDFPNMVRMHTYESPNKESSVELFDLTKNALRQRLDRMVIGEVRGSESLPMLMGMRSGTEGSLCTIHSDSARNALDSLVDYVLTNPARLNPEAAARLVSRTIKLIVTMQLLPNQKHRVVEVAELEYESESNLTFVVRELFGYDRLNDQHKVGTWPSISFQNRFREMDVEFPGYIFKKG